MFWSGRSRIEDRRMVPKNCGERERRGLDHQYLHSADAME